MSQEPPSRPKPENKLSGFFTKLRRSPKPAPPKPSETGSSPAVTPRSSTLATSSTSNTASTALTLAPSEVSSPNLDPEAGRSPSRSMHRQPSPAIDEEPEEVAAPDATTVLAWSTNTLDLKPIRTMRHDPSPPLTESPIPLWGHSVCPIPGRRGEFLVFGGFKHDPQCPGSGPCLGEYMNTVWLLSANDASLMRIETSGDAPGKRYFSPGATIGRVLIVWGTLSDESMYFLDLSTWQWTTFQPVGLAPAARQHHSLTACDESIFIFGGRTDENKESELNDLWTFNVTSLTTPSPRWERIRFPAGAHIPPARDQHSVAVYDEKLYIFGGGRGLSSARTFYNDTWEYDIKARTWTELECSGLVPQSRDRHNAAVVGDIMYIFGGMSSGGFKLQDRLAFNIPERRWFSFAVIGRTPDRRTSGSMVTNGETCLVFGGHTPDEVGKPIDTIALIHTLDCRPENTTKMDRKAALALLQFAAQETDPEDSPDLSMYIAKSGDSAHSLAGFSDVWRGELKHTGQDIAIKMLRGSDKSAVTRKRFKRETKLWKDLKHIYILELLGHAFIEGVPCLISPWCTKGNVFEYITRRPEMPLEERIKMISQVAEGLVYLHSRDPVVVHADVKAANVLVDDDGNCKVCDFGISKLVKNNQTPGLTTTGNIKGTIRYMSPELITASSESSTKSDVYAFGMLTLEITTGKHPLYEVAMNDIALVFAVTQGKRPSPGAYEELPKGHPLWKLLTRCWLGDADERPTMAEALDQVNSALGA